MIIKQLSTNFNSITLDSLVQYANTSGVKKESSYSRIEMAGMIAGILIAVGFPLSYAVYHANIRAEYLAAHPEYIDYGKTLVESKSPETQQKIQEIVSKVEDEDVMNFDIEQKNETQKVENVKTKESSTEAGYQSCEVTSKLVQAIIDLEYDPNREVSSKGATGRMQIMKPTWEDINQKHFGGKYPYVPYAKNTEINIKFGTQYLKDIKHYLDSHRKDWNTDELPLIFACYIGGWNNIRKRNFDPELIKSMPDTYDYMQRGSNLMGYQGEL